MENPFVWVTLTLMRNRVGFFPCSPRLRQIDVASCSCVMQLRTAAVSNFSLWFDFERAFFFPPLFYSTRSEHHGPVSSAPIHSADLK